MSGALTHPATEMCCLKDCSIEYSLRQSHDEPLGLTFWLDANKELGKEPQQHHLVSATCSIPNGICLIRLHNPCI